MKIPSRGLLLPVWGLCLMLLPLLAACRRDAAEVSDRPRPSHVTVPVETAVGGQDTSVPVPEPAISGTVVDEVAPEKAMAFQKNPLAGCQLCHVDIEDEFLPSVHFAEKIGCVDCHGASEGHLADENNEVKPEVLFTRDNTDSLCEECHGCSRPEEPKSAAAPKICTDCHGAHDLAMAE